MKCFLRGRLLVVLTTVVFQNDRFSSTVKSGRFISRAIHLMNSVALYQGGLFCIIQLKLVQFLCFTYDIFQLDPIEHCIYSFDMVFSKDF